MNKVINKTMQNLVRNSQNGNPMRPPRSPPLLFTPDYMCRIFSVEEVTILLNLP